MFNHIQKHYTLTFPYPHFMLYLPQITSFYFMYSLTYYSFFFTFVLVYIVVLKVIYALPVQYYSILYLSVYLLFH